MSYGDSTSNFYPSPIQGGASPAGAHYEGHRTDNKRMTDVFKGMYHWVRKRLPTVGAGNYAFSTLSLYELSPIGPGVASRQLFKTTQPPQLYMNGQLVGQVGIGGLVAGQYVQQPLLDPASQTYGGVPI